MSLLLIQEEEEEEAEEEEEEEEERSLASNFKRNTYIGWMDGSHSSFDNIYNRI